jgi:hypothetical protein
MIEWLDLSVMLASLAPRVTLPLPGKMSVYGN